jgi:hypothetical protein
MLFDSMDGWFSAIAPGGGRFARAEAPFKFPMSIVALCLEIGEELEALINE